MENQLLKICERTLQEFLNFILSSSSANRFKLNIIVQSNELILDPPISEFNQAFCKIFSDIVDAVSDIERLETKLYLDWTGTSNFLKVDTVWEIPIVNEFVSYVAKLFISLASSIKVCY